MTITNRLLKKNKKKEVVQEKELKGFKIVIMYFI